jgi:hypothetical protein
LGASGNGISDIPQEWIAKVLGFESDQSFEGEAVGRKRPEYLCPRYHLIALIKAIIMNRPSKLRVKIKGEIVEDVDSVIKNYY